MSEYVDFHYMPLEGKITGKQVLKQTEDAINDLGNKVYNLDIDQSEIDEAIEKSNEAINTANSALAAVTTGRSVWFNNVAEMVATDIEAGVTAETKGYHVANDGGNALYLIRQEKSGDVVDGGSLIALDNGNMAELVTDGTVNVKQFGAIGNGTDDDTTVFQNTSSYAQANGFVPFVGVATYKITGSVTGTFNSFGEVTITGGGTVDIINLQEVVSDVSDIRDEVVDETASAKAYSESAATSATNASNSASSAQATATALTDIYNEAISSGQIVAPAVDPTLTISGAAADAKVTGMYVEAVGECKKLTGTYRQGYCGSTGAYEDYDSGRSYLFDISSCTHPIKIYMNGNNTWGWAFYDETISNWTTSLTADKFDRQSSNPPTEYTFNPADYSGYNTMLINPDYNNANPSALIVIEMANTKEELQNEIGVVYSENVISPMPFSVGSINASTGANASSPERIRTDGYVPILATILKSSRSTGRFYVYAWEGATFKGGLKSDGTFAVGSSNLYTTVDFTLLRKKYPTYSYKFVYLPNIEGTVTLALVADLSAHNILYAETQSEKIRVMFNNVGMFNFGSKTTKMSTADAQAKMENYKQFYAQYQPNVLALEEFPMDTGTYTKYIDSSETIAPSDVLYPYIYPYNTEPYHYATIYTDKKIISSQGLAISLPGYDYGVRGNLAVIQTSAMDSVAIISTVFDVNGTDANRTAQMNKCIELLADYDYGILCVDTNMLSQSEYDAMKTLFESAGYQLANGGFYPLTDTCPAATYKPIDNIMVKGNVKIKSFIVPDVLSDLSSDHLPIVADLLLY